MQNYAFGAALPHRAAAARSGSRKLAKALPASGRVDLRRPELPGLRQPAARAVLRDGVRHPTRSVRGGAEPGPALRRRQRPAAQLPGRGPVHRARRHPAVDGVRAAVVLPRRPRLRGHGVPPLLRGCGADHGRLRRPAALGQAALPDGGHPGARATRSGSASSPSATVSIPSGASPTTTSSGCSGRRARRRPEPRWPRRGPRPGPTRPGGAASPWGARRRPTRTSGARPRSSPSSSGSTGHSSVASPSAATTHHALKRPAAAPRRRPCAPPLAPAQPSQASACSAAMAVARGRGHARGRDGRGVVSLDRDDLDAPVGARRPRSHELPQCVRDIVVLGASHHRGQHDVGERTREGRSLERRAVVAVVRHGVARLPRLEHERQVQHARVHGRGAEVLAPQDPLVGDEGGDAAR